MTSMILNDHLWYSQTMQRKWPRKFQAVAMAAEVPSATMSGQQLLESGAVKSISAKRASEAMAKENFILLDIRPSWEWERASVAGSLHVPLFIADPDNTPLTFLKKWIHLGYIGLWTGQKFTTINPDFLPLVQSAIPHKDANILVACGEGLRSKMALSRLHERGYKNLGWLAGGFNRAEEGDFASIVGPEKLQYSTIGGASYLFFKLVLLLQGKQ